MRPESEYQAALDLVESGMNDSAISRQLGVPRGTIRAWRVGRAAGARGRTKGSSTALTANTCFRCMGLEVDWATYAYLLGVYLGDGSISSHPRAVYRLRVACDIEYLGIISEIATAIELLSGGKVVGVSEQKGCLVVGAYWKHWVCLFPQHGPGRKHERPIKLEAWQVKIVQENPKALIRGLIHTDGSRHLNRVVRPTKDGLKTYQYPRYMFTNASTDILALFTETLESLAIHWTRTSPRDVSIARKHDVTYLDSFVGPKA